MIKSNTLIASSCIWLLCGTIPSAFSAEIDAVPKAAEISSTIQATINGRVMDVNGVAISGATVTSSSNGTQTRTSATGTFSIRADMGDELTISYVGYETKTVPIVSEDMTIVLSDEMAAVDEVVVIGYGTTTRRSIVGAVDQVNAKAIENRPVANLTQALQGTAPGLNIQQRSMDPNSNTMNINIRGISTMNSNAPLIVIDGLVSDGSSLNKLNPNDIESVSVLKDAGTAAIYGSRSANGVLLVTTKRGQMNQRPSASISTQTGYQNPEVLFSPVTGYQNATLRNLALTNVGMAPQFSPSQILDLYDNRAREMWNYDEILQPALQQNYNVTVQGGGENSTYLFSAGYFDQGSNFVGDGFGIDRFNIRSNVSAEYGRFKLSSILHYTRNNGLATTATNAIINSSRVPPYYYYRMQAENGRYLVNNALTDQNPLAELHNGGFQKHANDYLNINLGLEVQLFDGLKFRGVFGADINADHRFIRRIQFPLYASADAERPLVFVNPNRETEDFNEKVSLLNYQFLLDYNKTFGNHAFTGLLGATNESYTLWQNEIKMIFTDPILGTPVTGTEIDPTSYNTPGGTVESSISSLLGRVGYTFADRYIFEGSVRYDGSSVFAPENRWGFFPSGSVGWRMTEEAFLSNYRDKVGEIKLRATYGILGNQDIGNYQYLTRYDPYVNTYAFNNQGVAGAGFTYGNEDLRWEKTYNFNIGADATFLDGRLTATFDYFHNNTVDILLVPEIPSVFGTTLSHTNAGQMVNQGWELSLSYRMRTGEFQHSFLANIGDSFNRVTYFMGEEQISTHDGISRITREGLPFQAYYGHRMDGYFQNMTQLETSALPVGLSPEDLRPGDVRYVDRNNDGIIDSKDRYVLGHAFPRYTFGFTYDLSYKDFDFNMFWQGVGKRDMVVRGELVEPFHENYSFVIYQHQLDYWTPTNTGATWPRLTAAGATSTQNNYQMGSDLYLFDGQYARLKNLQIGYSLPAAWINRAGMQRARLFVNGQNLFTLSRNSWIDPESSEFDSNMGGSANSGRNYPLIRYYGFGVDVKF